MLKVSGLLASLELWDVILTDTSETLETSTYFALDCLDKLGAFNSTLLFHLFGALIADSLLVELDEIARWRLFCTIRCDFFNSGIALNMQLVTQFNFASI